MKLLELVQKVLDTKVINAEVENQIRTLLWSPHLTEAELAALEQLNEEMTNGTVKYLTPEPRQEWFAA